MRTIMIIKYLFSIIGLLLLTSSLFLYLNTRIFIDSASVAEGTVVELITGASSSGSSIYTPVVQFKEQDGRSVRFTSSSSSNPPAYLEGAKVKVYYLPSNPLQAKIDSFFSLWGMPSIFGVLGVVFFAIGLGIFLSLHLQRRKNDYLKRHGTPIATKYQDVMINKGLSSNGQHPFRVVTYWNDPDSPESYLFESDDLWFDPTAYLTTDDITVYIEGNDLKNYYVDLSFLPKMVN